jgi:hypothetical protein
VNENLGKAHDSPHRDEEPKWKKWEVERDSGSYNGKFLLGPKGLVAVWAEMGMKR